MLPWQEGFPSFTYEPTEHPCPECGRLLTKVDVSSMLICNENHGPYFLI